MVMLIAFLTMASDHIGSIFFPNIVALRIVGRLALPLFAWGIARGYRYTRNFKKYAARLLILAIIAQVPYYLVHGAGYLNVCFNLFAGLLFIKLYDSKLPLWSRCTGLLVLAALPQVFNVEYGTYGVLMIFLFHKFWNHESVIYYQAALTLASVIIWHYDPIQLFSVFSPILLLYIQFFKKSDFKLPRPVQYGFYPVHLLLFDLIKNGGLFR
jgi:hypothetical protein